MSTALLVDGLEYSLDVDAFLEVEDKYGFAAYMFQWTGAKCLDVPLVVKFDVRSSQDRVDPILP
jgi:hypothetical protein